LFFAFEMLALVLNLAEMNFHSRILSEFIP
jgi:hypothetical protein